MLPNFADTVCKIDLTNQVFVSRYQLYLPDREQLEAELIRFMGGESRETD